MSQITILAQAAGRKNMLRLSASQTLTSISPHAIFILITKERISPLCMVLNLIKNQRNFSLESVSKPVCRLCLQFAPLWRWR